jgi:endonuclease-3
VWRIGEKIVGQYGGDASRIWADSTLQQVQERLDELRVGEQISLMIVGALCDTKWINSAGGDVKADRHLNRVVGRVFSGERISSEETIRLTRLMNEENPWLLDKPLFDIGQTYCHPTGPECAKCYLRAECCHAGRHGGDRPDIARRAGT